MPVNEKSNLYEQLEAVLATLQLGDIASDHRAEVQGFNGWNYVAVTAVARQALRSLVYVYDDNGSEAQQIRKSLRLEYGAKWRKVAMADKSLRKAIVREHQGEVIDSRHPLVRLLHRPNPYQSGGSFRWEQIQQLRLHGSCLVFERPNVMMNRTVQRYVIPMSIVTPIKPGRYKNMPRGGIKVHPSSWNTYAVSVDGGGSMFNALQQFINVDIPAEWLTIIKYPHPMLRGDGASPTNAASRWIDAGTMVDQTRMEFYKDGPNGKVLITADMSDPRQVEELEDRLSRRLGQDGPRVTIVGNGAQLASKRTADEMAFVESHDQLRDATLAVHGVSRAMTGSQEGMTYGSLAASLLGSTMLSVQPDMDLIADEESVSIGKEYGEGVCIEYEVPAINDPELEDRRLQQDASLGVMTVGEYRMKRGEPLFGTEYDDYILTSSGPVSPSSLIKPSTSVEQPIPDPESPMDLSFPGVGVPEMKSLAFESAGVIAVDDTLLESLDPQVIDAFHESGFQLQPLMDSEDEGKQPKTVWDWSQGTQWRNVVKMLPQGNKVEQLVKSLEAVEATQRKYACVMLLFPDDINRRLSDDCMSIADEHIAVGGRELEPHVTALYGIMGAELEDIVRVVSRMSSPLVKFGWVDAFPAGDDGCPLFVKVESPELVAINEQLRAALPHVVKYPDYNPHATLGYVTDPSPYQGKLCSVSGKSCYASKALISMADGTRAIVPLRRPYIEDDRPRLVHAELVEEQEVAAPKEVVAVPSVIKSFMETMRNLEIQVKDVQVAMTRKSDVGNSDLANAIATLAAAVQKAEAPVINNYVQPADVKVTNEVQPTPVNVQPADVKVTNEVHPAAVTVQPADVHIDVQPTPVTVNAELKQPDVIVNVPEVRAPDVTVNVAPEMKMPEREPISARVVRDKDGKIVGLESEK